MKKPGIKEYIAAGAPLLFVRTVESDVAEAEVRKQAAEVKSDKLFGVWKCTNGLMTGNISGGELSSSGSGDIGAALRYVGKHKGGMVVVFHNVRALLQNMMVVQQIIDTVEAAKRNGSHLILVGPYLPIPEELSHLLMVIDIPLPTREQIELNFKKMVKAYSSVLKLPNTKKEVQKLIRDAANSAVGLPMSQAENAIALSMATSGGKIDIDIIQSQKEQEVKKSDCLEFINTQETMDNVGGFEEFKAWMKRRSKVFTDEARKFGLEYPKGVMLVGAPGTGKSLAAKAASTYLRLPIIRLDMGKVFDSLVGASEARMRLALKTIEAVAPVIMWIDEVDKGLAGSSSGSHDSGVSSRVVGTLLTWRQETTAPVFMIATANDVEAIPSTVYRKGRMDEIWATDLPTSEEREEIFKIHITKNKRDPKDYNLKLLSEMSDGFVGSEIESCIHDAMFSAFDEGVELATRHITTAITDTIPQSKRDSGDITKIREWVQNNARYVGRKHIQQSAGSKENITILSKN